MARRIIKNYLPPLAIRFLVVGNRQGSWEAGYFDWRYKVALKFICLFNERYRVPLESEFKLQ